MQVLPDLQKYGVCPQTEYTAFLRFERGWGPKYETLELLESNMFVVFPEVELENFDHAIQEQGTVVEKGCWYRVQCTGKRLRVLGRLLQDLCTEFGVQCTVTIDLHATNRLLPNRLVLTIVRQPNDKLATCRWSVETGKWVPSWTEAIVTVIFDSAHLPDQETVKV